MVIFHSYVKLPQGIWIPVDSWMKFFGEFLKFGEMHRNAAPGITVGVRHGLVPALASKPQNLRSSFRRRAACLAMVPP